MAGRSGWMVAALASAACALAPMAGAAAKSATDATPQGRNWAEIAKLPDFTTGIWESDLGPAAFKPQAPPAFTPEYQAKYEAYQAAQKAGKEQETPDANCLPPGMPEIMNQPYPMQFFFSPGQVSIQLEAYMQMRHIYTDGRPLPDDPDPTFNGSSIGHWEGKTLVVDSIGFVPDTPLGLSWGMRHSDKMRIHETMKLTGPDTLLVTTTVEDPKALTKPWTTTRTFKRHRDWTIAEYICEQNNRNSADSAGKAGIDLTPPKTAQ